MKTLGGEYLTEKELQNHGFAKLGKNVKIHTRASLYGLENIEIGDNVRIDDFAVIIATNRCVIKNHVSIHNFCFLGSKYGITLGNFVTLAPGVKIFTASDDYHGNYLTGVTVAPNLTGGKKAPVHIEDHVIFGANAIVLPGCRIGEGAAIGALSLVKTNLSAWGIYGGIPARLLKERNKDLLELIPPCLGDKNHL